MALKSLLHNVFDVERQSVLEEARDFAAVLTVAVTDGEEVAVLEAEHVGGGDVRILISLVRVMRSDTTLCGEGEFRHHVAYSLSLWLRAGMV